MAVYSESISLRGWEERIVRGTRRGKRLERQFVTIDDGLPVHKDGNLGRDQ